ncbi:MAG: hypothetical protein SFU98_10680 [Leptospiraceae bacterium]|nr:hypothetical protein [Leptospiraceae bacterium]
MNTSEIKLELFRKIDSLPEEVLFQIQKPILEILSKARIDKNEKLSHKRIRKRILNPIQVDKIYILERNQLNER